MPSRNRAHFEFFKSWDWEEEDDIYGHAACLENVDKVVRKEPA